VAQTTVNRASAASPAPVLADGRIDWPTALDNTAAAGCRKQLDRLFSQRAAGREVRTGTKEYRQACDTISQLDASLKGSIDTLPAAEYMAAKKMLKSLQHELTQPIQQDLVTQN
ncbi:MAG TPA: hypothetical protein VHY91_01555, partial [Pirellulales bacterium]|nr:hypothetical protein [Pirellulales bacterium]